MNESKSTESAPTLSNDPVFLNDEIEALHSRIYHLRRTNTMIRKEYAEDPDCIQALHENLIIVDRKLDALFVYFQLYRHITHKAHPLTKVYRSDLKVRDKMEKQKREPLDKSPRKLKEFDLDFVARKLKEKGKELKAQNGTQSSTKKVTKKTKNDDAGFIL